MRGEHYYLVLIGKDGTKYKVFSKPITLRTMDERTTKYENKKELISTILQNKKLDMKVSDFKNVEIWMEPTTKDKSTYKKEGIPLYKKDSSVLNIDSVMAKFEAMIFDRNFALQFVKRYKNVKNFKPIAEGIEALIKNNEDYSELMQTFAEKLFKTYKGVRNIYLSMKNYEKTKDKKRSSSKDETSSRQVEIDENEIIEDRLRYLKEYERELLDIEDFNHHKDLSCFDEHRRIK